MTTACHPAAVRNVGTVTVHAVEQVARRLSGDAACDLPLDDMTALAACLRVRTLRPGQVACGPDEPPDGVWIVHSGAVELTTGTGERHLVAQVLRDGAVFGDIPLLTGRDAPYHCRAVGPTTCLWLPAEDFLRLLAQRPAIARLWLSSCAMRTFELQTRLPGLLDGPLPRRTAVLLLREARDGVVALSQATLAAMLGIPRPSLNRVLRVFQRQGLIALCYRQVRILDKAGLNHVVHNAHLSA